MQTAEKQRKLDKFVDQNVHHLCNHYVELCQENEYEFYDNVANLCNEGLILELEDKICEWGLDSSLFVEEIEDAQEEIFDLEHNQPEVHQWFFVSEWLSDRLLEKNEVIFNSQDGMVWGRQCCGQAIFLDSVIESIYDELNQD